MNLSELAAVKPPLIIEPPRVRTIMLGGATRRLSFPHIVYLGLPFSRDYRVTYYPCHHVVFVAREITEPETRLFQFPLTLHIFGGLGTVALPPSVPGASHIGRNGSVCYSVEAQNIGRKHPEMAMNQLFWHTRFIKFDTDFVLKWAALTEKDPIAARAFAIREECEIDQIRLDPKEGQIYFNEKPI